MVKKWLLVFLLICSPLKSFDLSENCPKEFVSGTFFGPAAVCAFYALIVHPFLNNDSKKPKVSTTVTLGAAGLYGMLAAIFLKGNPVMNPEFIAGGCFSAGLFAYWVNYKILVIENQSRQPLPSAPLLLETSARLRFAGSVDADY